MPPFPRLASTTVVVAVVLLLCLFHSPAAYAADESALTAEQQANTLQVSLQAFAGAAPGLQSTWTGTSFCSWPGVTCSNAIVGVSFKDVTLTSPMTLPEVPSDVDATKVAVTSLHIFQKKDMVTGTLPASWGGLKQLQVLNLDGNALSGTLPSAWVGMTALDALDLRVNALTGTLPAEWSAMTTLRTVQLSKNNLSGSLPASWGTMPALRFVFVAGNAFCGCIPAKWTANPDLYVFDAAALRASNCATANACATRTEAPRWTTTVALAAHKLSWLKLTALWYGIDAGGGLLVAAGIVVAAVMYHRRARTATAERVAAAKGKTE